MEGIRSRVIEGMTIAGFATGCERGFLYVRGEYPLAHARIAQRDRRRRAPRAARRRHPGRGFAFDLELRTRRGRVHLRRGDGAVQLDRGQARRAAQQAAVPGRGRAVRQADRREQRRDPRQHPRRSCSAAARPTRDRHGAVDRTRLSASRATSRGRASTRSPFGTTLRELLDAGRRRPDGRPQAVLLGGAAGTFVGAGQARLPLTFEGTRAAGATLGSGVVMRLRRVGRPGRHPAADRGVLPRRVVRPVRPCRVGTVRQEEVLQRLASGTADRDDELALLNEIGQVMRDASICGLGQTAATAVESAIGELGVLVRMTDRAPHRRAEADRRADDRRPGRARHRGLDDPRRVPPLGIDTPTLCYGEPDAGERLPRLRGRARGARTLVPACSRQVEEGWSSRPTRERVRARAGWSRVLELPRPRRGRPRRYRRPERAALHRSDVRRASPARDFGGRTRRPSPSR